MLLFGIALLHLVVAGVVVSGWGRWRSFDWAISVLLVAFGSFYLVPVLLGWVTGRFGVWSVLVGPGFTYGAGSVEGRSWWKRFRGTTDWNGVGVRTGAATWNLPAWVDVVWRGRKAGARAALVRETLLWVPVMAMLCGTFVIGSRLPIRAWDAVGYHAPNAMRWGTTGRFVIDSYGDADLDAFAACSETYPNVKAVLPALVLRTTGREAGTALAQWPFALTAVMALVAVGRRIGLPRWTLPVGAFGLMTTPEVLLQSMEAYADVVFLAGQLAVAWILLVIWQEGPSRGRLAMASLAFAVLATSKPTGYVTAVGLGSMLAAGLVGRDWVREKGWADMAEDPGASGTPRGRTAGGWAGGWGRGVGFAGLAVGFGFLCAGPWLFHAILRFSNPIYPLSVSLLGHPILPGKLPSDINDVWSSRYLGAVGWRGWWRVVGETDRSPVLAAWTGGLGAHFCIFGLPAILMLGAATVGRRTHWRRTWPVVALFAVLFATTPSPLVPRLILFEAAGAAIAVAWVLGEAPRGLRECLALGFVAVAGHDVYRTIPSMLYRARPAEVVAFDLLSGHSRAAMTDSFPDEYTALDFWREEVARSGKVLAVASDEPVWPARPTGPGGEVVRGPSFEASKAGGAERWAAELRKLGATHVHVLESSSGYIAAKRDGRDFRLLMDRVDSGSESPLNISPRAGGALFEILPPRTWAPGGSN